METINKTHFLFILLVILGACKTQVGQVKNKNKPRPESPIIKTQLKFAGYGSADTLLQTEEFDQKGNKIKLIKYFADGKTVEYEVNYKLNENGKTEEATTKYSDGTTETETHTFDKKGNVIKTMWQRSDGSTGRHEYKFDEHDSIIQWDWFEKGKFVISRLYPYVYDDDGYLIESFYKETNNGRDTNIVNQWSYSYDSIGRLVRKLSITNGQPSTLQEFIYDSLDNIIVELIYSPDSANSGNLTLSHRQVNIYNEYGEAINTSISKTKGEIDVTIDRKFDDYGHLTEAVFNYADGRKYIERYKYTFYEFTKVRE